MLAPFLLGTIQIVLYFIYPNTPPVYTNQQSDTFETPSSTENVKSRKSRLEELRRRKREKEIQRDNEKFA